jgi:hypothetical protein
MQFLYCEFQRISFEDRYPPLRHSVKAYSLVIPPVSNMAIRYLG